MLFSALSRIRNCNRFKNKINRNINWEQAQIQRETENTDIKPNTKLRLWSHNHYRCHYHYYNRYIIRIKLNSVIKIIWTGKRERAPTRSKKRTHIYTHSINGPSLRLFQWTFRMIWKNSNCLWNGEFMFRSCSSASRSCFASNWLGADHLHGALKFDKITLICYSIESVEFCWLMIIFTCRKFVRCYDVTSFPLFLSFRLCLSFHIGRRWLQSALHLSYGKFGRSFQQIMH